MRLLNKKDAGNVGLTMLSSVDAILVLSLTAVPLVFNIVEVILFARHALKPLVYLVFNCIKSVIWLFFLIFAILDLMDGGSILGLILEIIFFFAFLGTLIYASVVYHRHRQSTRYKLHNQNIKVMDPEHSDENLWSTTYGPHHARLATDSDRNELHLFGGASTNLAPESFQGAAATQREPGQSLQQQHLTSEELDMEAEAALHPGYRERILVSQHYKPLRREVYEMHDPDQANQAAVVSPVAASDIVSPADPTSRISSFSQSQRSGHNGKSSFERRVRRESAGMGGLIRIAASSRE